MAPAAELVLPSPKNADPSTQFEETKNPKATRVEDVDELTAASSTAATSAVPPSRFNTGDLIYPPPDIRTIVDKTASFVARNGDQFETKIRGDERANTKFAFLNPTDAYHSYYRAKIDAVRSGEGSLSGEAPGTPVLGSSIKDTNAPPADKPDAGGRHPHREETEKPREPRGFHFSAQLPNVTAVDLDILKLTALFTARKGRNFATELLAREAKSFQFEFLRPTHSLFGYFNRLVEQYRLVLEPPEDLLSHVRQGTFGTDNVEEATVRIGPGKGGGRMKTLESARERAQWEKWIREKKKKAEDEEQKERAAFNEIDWQDFVVAGTVELTEADAHIDLPPPMSLREVENMTMAQKKMAAMIMEVEGDMEEDVPKHATGAELVDGESILVGQGGALSENGVVTTTNGTTASDNEEDGDMEMEIGESDDETSIPQQQTSTTEETKRADNKPPIKVRKDYVPKTLAERNASSNAQTTICPVCGQSVALSEMDEHVRIELLNPRFTEQRRELEAKRAQHNAMQAGADPSRFLKQFAGARTDIFGAAEEEERQRHKEEDEKRRAREREKIIWDGHAASRQSTRNEFNKPTNLDAQKEAIKQRYKQPDINIGPQAAPPIPGDGRDQDNVPPSSSHIPLPVNAGLPPRPPGSLDPTEQGSSALPTAPAANSTDELHTESGAPSGLKRAANEQPFGEPAAQKQAVENIVTGGHSSPYSAQQQPFGYPVAAPTGPAIEVNNNSPRSNVPVGPSGRGTSSPAPPPDAPTGPRADQINAPQPQVYAEGLSKNADGTLHPEDQWARYHPLPISLKVTLPDATHLSARADGRTVELLQLDPRTTMGSIRDRIQAEHLAGEIGASKLKLKVDNRAATLKQSLSYWNLVDGDEVTINLNK